MKKLIAITIMYRTQQTEYCTSYRRLFTIPIRNYKKVQDWDDMMFKTGKYKK